MNRQHCIALHQRAYSHTGEEKERVRRESGVVCGLSQAALSRSTCGPHCQKRSGVDDLCPVLAWLITKYCCLFVVREKYYSLVEKYSL